MAGQHSLVVRVAWFFLVGWWLTLLAINVAWILNVTVVLLPIGVKIINRVPYLLTLKRRDTSIRADGVAQTNLLVRAVYFVFVGWWASFIWANVAWALCVTVIGIPIGIWMFNCAVARSPLPQARARRAVGRGRARGEDRRNIYDRPARRLL